jgi:peptidyl-prolyl cis-trans isomerase C
MKSVQSLFLPLLLVLLPVSACGATTSAPIETATIAASAAGEPGAVVAEPGAVVAEPGAVVAEPDIGTEEPSPPVDPISAEPLAVVINGASITLDEYEREVELYQADMLAAGYLLDADTSAGQAAIAQGRQWVLDLMIGQMLTEQAAAAEGVVITDAEVDAAIDSLRQDIGDEMLNDWLAQQGITLQEMHARLRGEMISTEMANRVADVAVPAVQEHIAARHILVATEVEARRIYDQLNAGADFASMARTHSQDVSTRDLGGDLGFFPKGVLTSKEVEAAAFALQPGQLSDVISSDLGYHIVQVVERVDQEISPQNLQFLREQVAQAWLDELRFSADIQIFVTP